MSIPPVNKDDIHKIAVFRALYLGDMLCVIPAVRAVRTAFPSATITLVGLPWQKDFAKRFAKYFDEFIDFPGWPGLPEQDVQAEDIVRFLRRIRSEHFDLVLQMHGNGFISNNLCSLWGGKILCGLRSASQHAPDEGIFPLSEDDDHEALRFLKITDALGIPSQGSDLEFNFIDDELKNFKRMSEKLRLKQGGYVCLHAGARDVRRRWPVGNFAFVANYLCDHGYKIVLTGSVQEQELLESLQGSIKHRVINIVEEFGNVGLGELAAFLLHSKLLISNDTGVSHIAAALKVPSVIIFSTFSNKSRWAPLDDVRHQIISAEQANDPEFVLYKILDHLERNAREVSPVLLNYK